jgi:hypothetical protein
MMPHELTHRQDRVAIVNSVIAKKFNPYKYWTVTFNLSVKHSTIECLFDCPAYCSTFVFVNRFRVLFDNSVFNYSLYLGCSDTIIVFQVF